MNLDTRRLIIWIEITAFDLNCVDNCKVIQVDIRKGKVL